MVACYFGAGSHHGVRISALEALRVLETQRRVLHVPTYLSNGRRLASHPSETFSGGNGGSSLQADASPRGCRRFHSKAAGFAAQGSGSSFPSAQQRLPKLLEPLHGSGISLGENPSDKLNDKHNDSNNYFYLTKLFLLFEGNFKVKKFLRLSNVTPPGSLYF